MEQIGDVRISVHKKPLSLEDKSISDCHGDFCVANCVGFVRNDLFVTIFLFLYSFRLQKFIMVDK